MASDDSALIKQIFTDQVTTAKSLTDTAAADIQKAFAALYQSTVYNYDPYNWQTPPTPLIGGISIPTGPSRPVSPIAPTQPTLVGLNVNVPNPNFGSAPTDVPSAPAITFPTQPGGEPTDNTGAVPSVYTPTFPTSPTLLSLPSSTLPYPSVSLPTAPTLLPPSFDGSAPGDISTIDLNTYLQKLSDSYSQYSHDIPGMIQNNALQWFRAIKAENPNIVAIDGMITTYLTMGGSGIPVAIEEAIVTRATDRLSTEYQRKNAEVWDEVARRGLTLPSGALVSGRKAARAEMAEGVAKVATDVAIKNLDLEHDHMKFMMNLGFELQKFLASLAMDAAKTMLECNAQAIEMTKLVLQGMIEINNAIVKIYLAKWEGYKAAVEAFKAKIEANEAQVRLYEAQIKGELAKTEVNKAVVEVLTAIVSGNRAIAEMYKVQIDAETAKIEGSRVRVLAYEAAVRGFVAKVDAYKAKWDGYRAAADGQVAVAKIYESQVQGFRGKVEAYSANVHAYGEQVRGYSAQVEAASRQNETALKAWGLQWDGIMKAYATDVDAYGRNWSALGEQMRAQANVLGVQGDFLSRMYNVQTQIEIERSREHFSQWQSRLRQAMDTAKGIESASSVAASMANSSLNSLSAFAGTFVQSSTGA
jgi:hypothetical protein